nr:hypothetical protein [uncultured Flavobacterium sp.]
MIYVKIKIAKFIDDSFPGFVECTLVDALNKLHIIIDKVPVVTDKYLDANSDYPQDGEIACTIIKQWTNDKGQKIYKIDTSPWGIDSIEELKEFDVFEEQLVR